LDSATTAATSWYSTKFEQPTTAFNFIVTLQLLRHFGEPLLASPAEGFEQPTTAFDFIVTLQLLRHFGEPLLASPGEGFKVLAETQSCNSSKPVT
jgi:hypothetical protein